MTPSDPHATSSFDAGWLRQRASWPTGRLLRPEDLTAADFAAWRGLEARAAEPNVYQSPDFALAALTHLDPDPSARVLLVDEPASGQLIGAAVLKPRGRSPWLRLPHVEVYRSRHSYLGAPLLDPIASVAAAHAMLRTVRAQWPGRPALLLRGIAAAGPAAQAFAAAAGLLGLPVHGGPDKTRAMLRPASAGPASLPSGKRGAELRRCLRRLSEAGALTWRFVDGQATRFEPGPLAQGTGLAGQAAGPADLEAAASTFLQLEHQGWRGEAGSSLLSQAADAAFFRASAAGLAANGQLWFTELQLDGKVIASTCNFRSGGAGFAFKLGWDPAWRQLGPGWLNEALLVATAPHVCADMAWIDSGAAPASFIDELWTERRHLTQLAIPLGLPARLALWGLAWARRLRRLQARPVAVAEPSTPGTAARP